MCKAKLPLTVVQFSNNLRWDWDYPVRSSDGIVQLDGIVQFGLFERADVELPQVQQLAIRCAQIVPPILSQLLSANCDLISRRTWREISQKKWTRWRGEEAFVLLLRSPARSTPARMATPLIINWKFVFVDLAKERAFSLYTFKEQWPQMIAIGLLSLFLQSVSIFSYIARREFGTEKFIAAAATTIVLLLMAIGSTIVCAVVSSTAVSMKAPSSEQRVLLRAALVGGDATAIGAPIAPSSPKPQPFVDSAAPWVSEFIQSGYCSFLWCLALLTSAWEMQYFITCACSSPHAKYMITCVTYNTGGYPLLPSLHACTLSFLMLFVSSKPVFTFSGICLIVLATFSSIWQLYPGVDGKPFRLFLSFVTLSNFMILALTCLYFSLAMAYSQRKSYYRLHALVHSFALYDEKVSQLRATEEREARSRSALLATMSHEMRTPLTGILGSLELLSADLALRSKMDATQSDLLSIGYRCGDSLLRILNDILDFSKLEAGQVTAACNPFQIRALLDDIAAIFSVPLRQKGVLWRVLVDDNVPSVLLGDPTLLRRVLINLCGNATKFTSHGSVSIAVSFSSTMTTTITSAATTTSQPVNAVDGAAVSSGPSSSTTAAAAAVAAMTRQGRLLFAITDTG